MLHIISNCLKAMNEILDEELKKLFCSIRILNGQKVGHHIWSLFWQKWVVKGEGMCFGVKIEGP